MNFTRQVHPTMGRISCYASSPRRQHATEPLALLHQINA
jgi:hypothetical protein